MSEYFQEPNSSRANVKFEVGLSNHITKADFKNATRVDTWIFLKIPISLI